MRISLVTILSFAFSFLFAFSLSATVKSNSLKPFETDGCTMFIDGPRTQPSLWRQCCVEHDLRYWFGGNQYDMDKTDLRLKSCVNDIAGPTWAELIYLGVRTGHKSPIKNKTQWGWGWNLKRPNSSLNTEESRYIIEEVRRLPFDQLFIEQFIKLNFSSSNA